MLNMGPRGLCFPHLTALPLFGLFFPGCGLTQRVGSEPGGGHRYAAAPGYGACGRPTRWVRPQPTGRSLTKLPSVYLHVELTFVKLFGCWVGLPSTSCFAIIWFFYS